jgi:predicted dehydrogenase
MSIKPTRIGIVGVGFGQQVLVPAFRTDQRCVVTAMCASTTKRGAEIAARLGIPQSYGNWQSLTKSAEIDVVAIATPATIQPTIAKAALANGKAVLCEKPLATSLEAALMLRDAAQCSGRPVMIDFEFPEIPSWQRAKTFIRDGEIGMLRHVQVIWNVETYANRMGLDSWKTQALAGGTLNSFVSHTFYYLEWLVGPIAWLSAHLLKNPGDERSGDTLTTLTGQYDSGAGIAVTASSDALFGNGHKVTLYGTEGTLILDNPTSDYIHGFGLKIGRRGSAHLEQLEPPLQSPYEDGRITAVSSLVSRLIDWARDGTPSHPNLEDAIRVQTLLDAARRSHNSGGSRLNIA